MNRYQERMPPGSEEAKRSYCTCKLPSEIDLANATSLLGEETNSPWIDPDCPLHSSSPLFKLPASI